MARKRRPARQGRSAQRLGALLCCCVLISLAGCASSPDSGHRDATRSESEAGAWVTIQRGDTLGEIAQRFNIPLERLQRFNPEVNPRRLLVGQQLLIPSQQERAPRAGPYRYQIRPGDTFAGIARHFGVRTQALINANSGVSPTGLRIGQTVNVPISGTTSSSPSGNATARRPAPPADLPTSANNWPWPLEDYRIVRRFGTDDRGTLQPMLLATQAGAQATAVAAGDVRYAGSMRQLGNVVIVHHPGNLQSVYALCSELVVTENTQVAAGDAVCEVGRNTSGRHDLLFDLRQGGKPIDPRRVLK